MFVFDVSGCGIESSCSHSENCTCNLLQKLDCFFSFFYFWKNQISVIILYFFVTFHLAMNSLRRNWMLQQPLAFAGCSSTQFPITQLLSLSWVEYHLQCSPCVTYRRPCHFIGHKVLPFPTLA